MKLLKLTKFLLLGFIAIMLVFVSQQAKLQTTLAQDGNFEYIGSEPLEIGSGNDGNFEYVGSKPLENCTETPREYPQCGGTVGLEDYPKTDTLIVRELTNTCSGAKRYEVVTNKGNLGQCAQSAPAPQQPAPQTVVTTTSLPACPKPGQSGTQQICGSQWAYDSCTIVERFSDGTPAKYRCIYSQNANCVGTYSCPAPTAAVVQPRVVKPVVVQPRVVQPPVVVTPIIPPAQGAGPINITNNNNNTNNNSNTNNNNISLNVSANREKEVVREVRTVTAGAPAPVAPTVVYAGSPQVQGIQVKELPKTGLPIAAWAALAFIPAGFRLRGFRKVKGDLDSAPIYFWEKRQYNRNYEQN
jgi:hypothetical protein